MFRHGRKVLGFAAAALTGTIATAQFNSQLVGFNGPPIDDPATSQEMFRIPQTSGTTAAYITANTSGFNNNWAFRASGRQTEDVAGLYVKWNWVTPANLESWCRLTTFDAPNRANPALHVGGKVRFKLINESELFVGRIGICLGVRETGVNVPQLANGGIGGGIEWVGVETADSVILAGVNTTLDSTPSGDDFVQAVAGGGSAIVAGPNGVLDSTAAGDDVVEQGFTYTALGERLPIPALELNPSALPYELEWNLATGVVSVGGVPIGGGYAGFTGDGTLSAANNRGVLEHIAIVNAETNGGFLGEVEFSIDELQFEAPVADPAVPPTVTAPIIAGATSVTVTGVQFGADRVELLRNHVFFAGQNISNQDPVVFDISADDANAGEVITARQRVGASQEVSGESIGVTVATEAPPFGMCVVLDEDGSVTDALGWEFLGAPNRVNLAGGDLSPNGTVILRDSAQWQTIDFPISGPLHGWLGGNGTVNTANPNYALETLWFNVQPGAAIGPHELFVDSVQAVDASNNVLTTIYNFDDGTNFLQAGRSQCTLVANPPVPPPGAFASQGPLAGGLGGALASFDGRYSRRVSVTFPDNVDESLALLFRDGAGGGATSRSFSSTNVAKIRVHLLARLDRVNPSVPLPAIIGPPVATDTTVRVSNDATATLVTLYVNGVQVGSPIVPFSTTTTFPGVTLVAGQSVSAKQVVGGLESDFAYPIGVVPTQLTPAAPAIVTPCEDGDTSVAVSGLTTDTDTVEIVDSTTAVIGSTTLVNPNGTATVPLNRPLDHLEVITVRAVNEAGNSPGPIAIEVGIGNGDVLIALGIRENAADIGALGSQGTASGPIEWVGATAAGTVPLGKPISPSAGWQTITFDPAVDSIAAFPGTGANGAINGTAGTIEHLAITVNAGSSGRSTGGYEIFVDNVVNVDARGLGDFVVSNFDSFTPGVEALFQEPSFSGTTSANLGPALNVSAVSSAEGNPTQSARLAFTFRDTGATRWVRLTTSGATNLSRPIIDISKPVRMDILLRPTVAPTCPGAIGDANCSGGVDFFDIDPFLLALFDNPAYLTANCGGSNCAVDVDCSGGVDFFDIDPFLACLFGGCIPCP